MAPRRVRSGQRGRAPPLLLLLLLLALLGPWPAEGHGGKYSREKNEPAGEFRMEKLNQLWEKAQRVSGGRGLHLGVRGPWPGAVIPALVRSCRGCGFGVP